MHSVEAFFRHIETYTDPGPELETAQTYDGASGRKARPVTGWPHGCGADSADAPLRTEPAAWAQRVVAEYSLFADCGLVREEPVRDALVDGILRLGGQAVRVAREAATVRVGILGERYRFCRKKVIGVLDVNLTKGSTVFYIRDGKVYGEIEDGKVMDEKVRNGEPIDEESIGRKSTSKKPTKERKNKEKAKKSNLSKSTNQNLLDPRQNENPADFTVDKETKQGIFSGRSALANQQLTIKFTRTFNPYDFCNDNRFVPLRRVLCHLQVLGIAASAFVKARILGFYNGDVSALDLSGDLSYYALCSDPSLLPLPALLSYLEEGLAAQSGDASAALLFTTIVFLILLEKRGRKASRALAGRGGETKGLACPEVGSRTSVGSASTPVLKEDSVLGCIDHPNADAEEKKGDPTAPPHRRNQGDSEKSLFGRTIAKLKEKRDGKEGKAPSIRFLPQTPTMEQRLGAFSLSAREAPEEASKQTAFASVYVYADRISVFGYSLRSALPGQITANIQERIGKAKGIERIRALHSIAASYARRGVLLDASFLAPHCASLVMPAHDSLAAVALLLRLGIRIEPDLWHIYKQTVARLADRFEAALNTALKEAITSIRAWGRYSDCRRLFGSIRWVVQAERGNGTLPPSFLVSCFSSAIARVYFKRIRKSRRILDLEPVYLAIIHSDGLFGPMPSVEAELRRVVRHHAVREARGWPSGVFGERIKDILND